MRLDRQLLDRQLLDSTGRMVGNVDDVRFAFDDDGVPYVAALLVGHVALTDRIGGRLGRLLSAVAHLLTPHGRARPMEIPYGLVVRVGAAVHLAVAADRLPEPVLEGWLRRHIIDKIPGAGRAGG
jgi:sporulation protein YlmC with PRC-barrel domain